MRIVDVDIRHHIIAAPSDIGDAQPRGRSRIGRHPEIGSADAVEYIRGIPQIAFVRRQISGVVGPEIQIVAAQIRVSY